MIASDLHRHVADSTQGMEYLRCTTGLLGPRADPGACLRRLLDRYLPFEDRPLKCVGPGTEMASSPQHKIAFARLSEISLDELVGHMSDPRVAEHMPLLTFRWDGATAAEFVSAKEECWRRDGLGHWAILCNGRYVGWGGFQKEGDEWDFGLVLKPDSFGLGTCITRKAIDFAMGDDRIPFVTFLLPPSRRNVAALGRLGARFVGEVEYRGAQFRKYRLDTS